MAVGLMRIRHKPLFWFRLYCKYVKIWDLINFADATVMAVLKDQLFLLYVMLYVAYNPCLHCFLKCISIIIINGNPNINAMYGLHMMVMRYLC